MAEGSGEERKVVPGGRRSGGLLHGEMTHRRGTEKPAAPRCRGRQERLQGRGGWGRGSRTDRAVDECKNERIDRVARYRFDVVFQTFACIVLSLVLFSPYKRYLSIVTTHALHVAAFLNSLRHGLCYVLFKKFVQVLLFFVIIFWSCLC